MTRDSLRDPSARARRLWGRVALFGMVSAATVLVALGLRSLALNALEERLTTYGRDLVGTMAASVHAPEVNQMLAEGAMPAEWVVMAEAARRNERVRRVGLMIGAETGERRWIDIYGDAPAPGASKPREVAVPPDLVATEECVRMGLREASAMIVWRGHDGHPRWVGMAPVRSAPLGETLGLLWIEFAPRSATLPRALTDQWFWAGLLGALLVANGLTYALFHDREARVALAAERADRRAQADAAARARAELDKATNALRDRDRLVVEQLGLARDIQHSFLPREFPFGQQLRCAVAYEACPGIGGDLFDFFSVGPRTVGFYIADASGHGITAALASAVFKYHFERWNSMLVPVVSETDGTLDDDSAARFELQARRFLVALNISLSDIFNKRLFVTLLMGLMDIETGEVLFLNAGHQPPIIWRAEGTRLEEISLPANIPLGVVADFAYDAGYARLRPGDKLLLYTDGITERMDARDREFGQHNLNQVFRANAHKSPELILASIRSEANSFGGQRSLDDDQAMLLVEYLGPPGRERPPDQLRAGLARARA